MGKETVAVKLEPETIEEVEAYMDAHEIETRSEGMRQLINTGLSEPTATEVLRSMGKVMLAFGGFGIGLAVAGEVSITKGAAFGTVAVFGVVSMLGFLYAYQSCRKTPEDT
jgi:hypothetical protein